MIIRRMLDLTIMYMMMVTYLMLLCSREEIEKGLSTVIVSCCEIMSVAWCEREEVGEKGMGHTRALLNLYSKAVIYIERADRKSVV